MEKSEYYIYPAVFTYSEGQEIAVEFPDLNCATSGRNEEDAYTSGRELLGCALLGLEEDGLDIPEPISLLDLELSPNQRGTLIDVYMPSVR